MIPVQGNANPTLEPSIEPTHPLQVRDFRFFLIGRFTAILGQFGLMLVTVWQAYSTARLTMDTNHAAAQLGFIGLAQFLPVFLLTPLSGWIADHFDRRRVTIAALTLQMVCTALLGIATYENRMTLPLLFTVAALLGVARCFAGPAYSSMAPRLVTRELLPRAIALSSLVWQGAMIMGPALGGYIYSIKPWLPHLLSVTMFATAITAVWLITPLPPMQTDRSRHPLRQMLDGIVYVRTTRLVLGSITLDLMAVMLAGSTALLPVYTRDIFHVGPETMGILAGATGVGAGLAALLFGFRPPRHNMGNRMLLAVAVFGASTALFGATAFMPVGIAVPVAFFALFLCGVSDMFSVFVRQTLVQLHTPDEMRGRVTSVSQLTISASNELGEAESGFLAWLIGPVGAVIAGGFGAIAIVVIWSRLFPELGLARSFDASENSLSEPLREKEA